MNFGTLSSELRFKELLMCALKADHTGGVMERRLRRSASAARLYMDCSKPHLKGSSNQRGFPTSYFCVESVLVLLFLTASLLLLPLVLPPLPPPPFLLLLLPVGILVVLMILAFTPSDVHKVASSYL